MGSGGLTSATHVTYTERFNEAFPLCLSLGMTYEQFWYKDPGLVRYYKEADEIRQRRVNFEGWLQGLYTYQAIGSFIEVLPAFPKKGAKVRPYVDSPFAITKAEQEEKARAEAIAKQQKMKAKMEQFMKQFNRRFVENERNENRCDNARDKRNLEERIKAARCSGEVPSRFEKSIAGQPKYRKTLREHKKRYKWSRTSKERCEITE